MIRITNYSIGVSPKAFIQKLVDMLSIENGQIVIKVQNKKFVHLQLQPSFKPEELENTETKESDQK